MNKVKVEIPQSLYREFVDLAKRMNRDADDLIRMALEQHRQQLIPRRSEHSVKDIQPMSLGTTLKPWTSRAELLEDFFDRQD